MGSSIMPSFRYRDAPAAISWLVRMFGFTERAVYPGPENTIAHAELALGDGMVMLGSATNRNPHADYMALPAEINGRITSPTYLVVADCEPVYARVQQAGVDIVSEMRTMDYGGKAFTVRDPEGYMWSVGEYDPWAPQTGAAA